MSMTSKLGDPDIKVGQLAIWVHGRQFPDAQDYWDSNWLSVTAEYKGRDSRVMAHGHFIHLAELTRFLAGLESLNFALKGEAVLKCLEPNLHIEIRAKSLGHLDIKTSLTADHMTESHVFKDEIDQTFLPPILTALNRALEQYPVRDPDRNVR